MKLSRIHNRGAVSVAVVAVLFPSAPRLGRAETAPGHSGAESPLLVVVETGAGAGCDATHVRRVVQEELGVVVVAPTAPPPKRTAALLVRVDRERIVVTFRGHTADQVSRGIPAPAEPAERLRAIAWLSGNMVRDQVSSVLSKAESSSRGERVPSSAPAAAPNNNPATATKDAAVVRGPGVTEPPALSALSSPATTERSDPLDDDLRVVGSRVHESRPYSPWSVTVGGGPAAVLDRYSQAGVALGLAPAWQIEVQHHGTGGSIYGLALDIGPEPRRAGGIAGLAGAGWRLGSWLTEATAGAGLEAQRGGTQTTTVVTSEGISQQTVYGGEFVPALYLRGMLAIGRPLTRSLDLFARLEAHLASNDLIDDFYSAASLGLRLRLP